LISKVVILLVFSLPALQFFGPVPVRATDTRLHDPIIIHSNSDFTVRNGVTGGNGTPADPYIIEGWEIVSPSSSAILIQDTNAYFMIRNVLVHSGSGASLQSTFCSYLGHCGLLDFENATNGIVENSTISDNTGYPSVVVVHNSANITILHNAILSNAGGAVLAYSEGGAYSTYLKTTVKDNLVLSNLSGIIIGTFVNAAVTGNDVSSSTLGGISVTYCHCNVSGNLVDNNGWGAYPLLQNGYGISAIRRCQCLVIGNTISNNPIGLTINDAPPAFHNNFINNTVQALSGCPFEPCLRPFDNGYPSGGNYWSDYSSATDRCSGPNQDVCPSSDGITDKPYPIISSCPGCTLPGLDRYPLLRPFAPPVDGTVQFKPPVIASQNTGSDLTAFIMLPQGFDASNIINSSIRLNGRITAESVMTIARDNASSIMIARFNMTDVRTLLLGPGIKALHLTANTLTSTSFRPFEASSEIRVLP